MLRKIDCVMTPVHDLEAAVNFYQRVFGLTVSWRDDVSVGMGLPESDAEVVLSIDNFRYFLVDDVMSAVGEAVDGGCRLTVEPFDIVIGMCAALEDPFGNLVHILDMSKGPRR